jgi:tetratricopeptide (TPR) repeat protein
MDISRIAGRKKLFHDTKPRKALIAGSAVAAAAIGLLILGCMDADARLDQGTPIIVVEDTRPNQPVVDQSSAVHDIVLSALDTSHDGSGQLATLNSVVAQHPSDPLAYHTRALFFSHYGLYNQALNDFNKAIELKPSYADAYINRGHVYVMMSELGRACADYNQALTLNPQLGEVYQYRAYVYYQLGEFSRAVEDYNQAILHHPTSDLYLMRGMAASNRDHGQPSGLSDFFTSMRTESSTAQAEYGRGDYTAAIAIDPNYAAAYNGRAYGSMYQSDFEAAQRDIAVAIALKPYSPIYYDSRCEFYLRAGEWSLGLADCATAESMGWYFSSYMQELIRDARTHLQG